MDPVEARLTELANGLKNAWKDCQDAASPLGYWAAVAAATLVFYQETYRTKKPAQLADESVAGDRSHWSDEWRRRE